jgi:sulfate adenylyltransferase subunit 2
VLTHLQRLESEAIHILREVVAEAENPVMLYSIGKDSTVMLHLAMKAFWPAPPPFPLLHIDSTWEFREMYQLREQVAGRYRARMLVHHNPEAVRLGINPFDHGSEVHTDLWRTQGLRQALELYRFDVAFGGGRRDEEKSRAKEQIFSFRTVQHRWDPKNERPELWHLYNGRKRDGEPIRAFPVSHWTQLGIWQYIHLEQIPIAQLYFAAERPVVERDGAQEAGRLLLTARPFGQPARGRVGVQRPRVEVPLALVALQCAECRGLFRGLHAFGHGAHAQAACHQHGGFHQHTVVGARRHLADEGAVDLDHVHRPQVQAGQ